MSDFDRIFLPWLLLAIAAGVYLGADVLARARRLRDGGDRGDYWSAVVAWTVLAFGAPLLLSGWIETLSETTWQAGWHLHFDRTGGWGLAGPWAYRAALALPFALWIIVLVVEVLRPPRDRQAGRWLAGSVGEGGSRVWILGAALPLAAVLVAAQPQLGGGPHGFPAAAWSFQGVLLLSLVGVARSRGVSAGTADATAMDAPMEPSHALPPWPEALSLRGIEARTVTTWPAAAPPDPIETPGSLHLAHRLEALGAREIEPQLVEAVDELLGSRNPREAELLIHAPDHAGQTEVVAVAATLLAESFRERTLVVTPGAAWSRAAELRRWLPPDLLQTVEASKELPNDALVWVVDAETLSNRFLPEKLRSPDLLRSLGLVVWWDLQDYSGVLAANLWAVSRRLDRLIRRWGRPDVRTLALIRRVPHGAAEAGRFVQSLLPHAFHRRALDVGRRFARRVELHLLEPGLGTSGDLRGGELQEAAGRLPFRAARASVDAGWPTHLEAPLPGVPDTELRAVLQIESQGRPLAARLLPAPEEAGASLLSVEGRDVLSLADRIARRGRSAPGRLPHHVGVVPPEDPYVRHLLRELARTGTSRGGFASSRRLVCAAGTPELLRRHLLLALEELPDTGDGLSRSFRRQDELIRKTLDALAEEGQLERTEVRYLDEQETVHPDHLYRSLRAGGEVRRPLSTVGLSLVEVADLSDTRENRGVRLRVDPERLPIEAYPGRVFLASGRRYRVNDWTSLEEAVRRGRVECEQEGRHCRTWRLRTSFLHDLDPGSDDFVTLSGGTSLLARLVVNARYVEKVRGAIRLEYDRHGLPAGEAQRVELRLPITTELSTRALVIRVQEPGEPSALPSVAQALRHVLPVHVGVAEDALEVVTLARDQIRHQPVSGLAVVDLYPGGIGLIDALGDDEVLLLHLLERARAWLEACPCQSDAGCEECLQSPAALAASPDLPPRRATALELLREVLDRS
jgi:hypothetical protein